jgi:hypothetical protein
MRQHTPRSKTLGGCGRESHRRGAARRAGRAPLPGVGGARRVHQSRRQRVCLREPLRPRRIDPQRGPVGLHDLSLEQLAPRDLALAPARRLALRAGPVVAPRDERRDPRPDHRCALPRPAALDRRALAQRFRSGAVRDPSPARRVGGLGGGAQGRPLGFLFRACSSVLRALGAPPRQGPVRRGGARGCRRPDGEADARDDPVRAAAPRLRAYRGRACSPRSCRCSA